MNVKIFQGQKELIWGSHVLLEISFPLSFIALPRKVYAGEIEPSTSYPISNLPDKKLLSTIPSILPKISFNLPVQHHSRLFFLFFNRMDIFFHFCLFLPQSFWHFPPVSHIVGPSQDDLLTGCLSSQRRWEIGIRQPVPVCYWIACGDSNKCYFICHQSHLTDGLTGRQPSRSCPHSRQGGRTKTRLLGVYSN